MNNHLNNLIDWVTGIIESKPGIINEDKTENEIDSESKLIDVIERKNDKEGIQLLLEKLISDLNLINHNYYTSNCINWRNELNENRQTINEKVFEDLKEIWLENIRRGSNS